MARQQQRLEELMAKQGLAPLKPAPAAPASAPAARAQREREAEPEDSHGFPMIYPLDPRDLKYLRHTPGQSRLRHPTARLRHSVHSACSRHGHLAC